jgi:MGT family glycosyltransferase
LPASGHVNPSLPLVAELVRCGDEVVYFATESFRTKVERTGARFVAYDNEFLSDLSVLPSRLQELTWLMARTTTEVLDRHLAEFRHIGPDYVITDSVAPWGQWTAQILGKSLVTSVGTMAFNRHVLSFAARHNVQPKSFGATMTKLRAVTKAIGLGRKLRRQYKVAGTATMGWVSGHSGLNIVYTSSYFQPCADTFDARYCFIGPSVADRGESLNGLVPPGDADLVYVSMGTLFNKDLTFYRTCFEALGGEPFRVILSVGTGTRLEDLGTAPSNFVVRQQVPQLKVLEKARVFVTHGGMNSVSESLYFGVPMVAIPQMSEQEIVARRAEELRTCAFLRKEDVTPERLREAVRRVSSDAAYRAAAGKVGESFQAAGGVERAAEAIFHFTGR